MIGQFKRCKRPISNPGVQGVTNVIEHLELYSESVEEIKTLSQRMKVIRNDLGRHVTDDFNEAFSASCKFR